MSNLTPRRQFGMEFAILARRWRAFLDDAITDAGLTEAAWAPLMHLQRLGDGVQQKVLAARIGIDTSTLVRLIDILESRQLVERLIDPTDRRGRLIHLTDNGRACVARIEATIARAEEELLAEVDDETLDQMRLVLTRINTRLDTLSKEPEQ